MLIESDALKLNGKRVDFRHSMATFTCGERSHNCRYHGKNAKKISTKNYSNQLILVGVIQNRKACIFARNMYA